MIRTKKYKAQIWNTKFSRFPCPAGLAEVDQGMSRLLARSRDFNARNAEPGRDPHRKAVVCSTW